MTFYKSIAKYYDRIFSGSPQQLEFIKKNISPPFDNQNILEIGCGTGSLTISLAEISKMVIGTDLDKEMLEISKTKSFNHNNIDFKESNMLHTEKHFSENSFNSIICLGNTLVHLNDANEIKNTFAQINKVLKSKGIFIFQIINYQNIFDNNIKNLPLINNNNLKFERYYHYNKDTNKILFSTILTDIDNNIIIKNEVPLFPILIDEIKKLLTETGFKNSTFFSNFNGDDYHKDGYHLIVKTEKAT